MSFGVTAQITEYYLDREKVIAQVGRQRAARLRKAGAYLRRGMRSRLRRRKRPSKPGQAPSVRSRDNYATLKNIRFGLVADGWGLVCGPLLVRRLALKHSNRKTVPELLEKGGTAMLQVSSTDGAVWETGYMRGAKQRREVSATYEERPFAGPTLEKEAEAGTLVDLWAG